MLHRCYARWDSYPFDPALPSLATSGSTMRCFGAVFAVLELLCRFRERQLPLALHPACHCLQLVCETRALP